MNAKEKLYILYQFQNCTAMYMYSEHKKLIIPKYVVCSFFFHTYCRVLGIFNRTSIRVFERFMGYFAGN